MTSKLETWIQDYLLWMIDMDYSHRTIGSHEWILRYFKALAKEKGWSAEDAVVPEHRALFLKECRLTKASAGITGFVRYLEAVGILQKPDGPHRLPEICEQYLAWYQKTSATKDSRKKRIRKILWDFHEWLSDRRIEIGVLKIDHVDDFLKNRNEGLAPYTCSDNRSIVKGFLRYLYLEKKMLGRNLASMIVSAPVFAYENPPRYLRKNEIRKLFKAMDLSSNKGLRTHAMTILAYTTGLRPKEIANIRLDDISFEEGELTVPERKGRNPIRFPLPEETVKAIAAYIIGARPDNSQRHLFVSLSPPHNPITGGLVSDAVGKIMKKAGVPGTAYWLRHTYAQNLLESGASVFEIREMLGHDCIRATKRYLHVHIRLMREVLFDD